jgi:hypothetical protein
VSWTASRRHCFYIACQSCSLIYGKYFFSKCRRLRLARVAVQPAREMPIGVGHCHEAGNRSGWQLALDHGDARFPSCFRNALETYARHAPRTVETI